jgi:hypothetical protein
MAAEVQLGGVETDRIFIDTDLTKSFHVKDIDADATGATAKDITGWAITFDVRKQDKSSTVLLTKSVGSGITISGVFNSTASSNLQRAVLVLADTDLTIAQFSSDGGTFRYSLKRTDAGAETILAFGDFVVERATQGA